MKKLLSQSIVFVVLMMSGVLGAMRKTEALNILGIPQGTPEQEKQKLDPAYRKLVLEYHKDPKALGAKAKIDRAGEAKAALLKF